MIPFIRICHASDWHGRFPKSPMPHADIYVLTGDMWPDKWIGFAEMNNQESVDYQHEWFKKTFESPEELRERFFANPDAPVVYCRGNHCFIDPDPYIGGRIYSMGLEATRIDVDGVIFGGYRGTRFINNYFSDGRMDDLTLADKLADDLDVLVSHAPPYGVLDRVGFEKIGMSGLSKHIQKAAFKYLPLKLSLFGHIHCEFGSRRVADVLCVNSSVGWTLLEADEDGNFHISRQEMVYDV